MADRVVMRFAPESSCARRIDDCNEHHHPVTDVTIGCSENTGEFQSYDRRACLQRCWAMRVVRYKRRMTAWANGGTSYGNRSRCSQKLFQFFVTSLP